MAWYNPFSWGEEDPVEAAKGAQAAAIKQMELLQPPPGVVPGDMSTNWNPAQSLPGAIAGEYQYAPDMERARGEAAMNSAWSPFEMFDITESGIAQDPSRAAMAQDDPYGNMAQYAAMDQTQQGYGQLGDVYKDFRDIYQQGGMTDIDRARWEEMKNRNLLAQKAQREATLQNMEARGMGGSGAELASVLQGQQAGNQNMSAESLGINAQAMQRAIDALGGAANVSQAQGALAGQLGNQGLARSEQVFNEQYQTGTAADIVNQFNTQNLRDTQMRNAQAQRDREMRRAQYGQGVISSDVGAANQAQAGNIDWRRQNYAADMASENARRYYKSVEEPWKRWEATRNLVADRINTIYGSPVLSAIQNQQNQSAQMMGNLMGAGGQVAAAYISKPSSSNNTGK